MESADSLYPWGESHVCGWGVVSLPFFWMDGLRPMCYPLGHNSSAGPRDEVCRTFEGNSNGIDRRGLWFRYQSRILLDSTVFEPWLWGLSQVLLQFYKKWFELWQLIFHCLLQSCFSFDLHKGRLFAGHVAGDSGTTLQIRKDCKSFGIICIFFCNHQFTECLGRQRHSLKQHPALRNDVLLGTSIPAVCWDRPLVGGCLLRGWSPDDLQGPFSW